MRYIVIYHYIYKYLMLYHLRAICCLRDQNSNRFDRYKGVTPIRLRYSVSAVYSFISPRCILNNSASVPWRGSSWSGISNNITKNTSLSEIYSPLWSLQSILQDFLYSLYFPHFYHLYKQWPSTYIVRSKYIVDSNT